MSCKVVADMYQHHDLHRMHVSVYDLADTICQCMIVTLPAHCHFQLYWYGRKAWTLYVLQIRSLGACWHRCSCVRDRLSLIASHRYAILVFCMLVWEVHKASRSDKGTTEKEQWEGEKERGKEPGREKKREWHVVTTFVGPKLNNSSGTKGRCKTAQCTQQLLRPSVQLAGSHKARPEIQREQGNRTG